MRIARAAVLAAAAVAASCCAGPARLDAQESGRFSAARAAGIVRTLAVDIGPRPMGSPAERAALEFAAGRLAAAGCDTVYVLPMTRADAVNTSSGVAVGILRGRTGRIIVLGGHIDSSGPEIPGAIDNASGSAVVLEAARVLGQEGGGESTVVFALFGGEEQGLLGSRHFVGAFEAIDSVVLMLQVDMANGGETLIMDPDAPGVSAPAWLVRAAVEEHRALGYGGLTYPTHYFALNYALAGGSASDHVPFLLAGIPAIDFTTDVGDPIHTAQDTWENFDPSGLQRSGDLVLSLVRRFDGGTPGRETASYWMYLLLGVPVIVPIPVVWGFVLSSVGAGFLLLLRLRRAHRAASDAGAPELRRWTTLKLWSISLLVAALGWMSPDLIGAIRGVRFPWYAHPGYYYVLGLIAALFGLLAGIRIAALLGIPRSPYVLFKRSWILLTALVLLTAVADIEVAVGPAVCLAMLSLALTVPHPFPAAAAAAVAPVWLFRLLFTEFSDLLFRWTAPQLPSSTGATAAINAGWILVLSVLVLAWLPGAAAVIRRRENPRAFIEAIRSRRFLVFTAGIFGLWTLLTLLVPAYERPWFPSVVLERLSGPSGDTLRVRSSEYLDGAVLRRGGVDTTLPARTLRFSEPLEPGRVRWLDVERREASGPADGGTAYDLSLGIRTPFRPYEVTVRYTTSRGGGVPVSTPLATRVRERETRIVWYSFPDTAIEAAVRFEAAKGDTVIEEITATFDTLAAPVELRSVPADVVRRSVVREVRRYPGPPAAPAEERQVPGG